MWDEYTNGLWKQILVAKYSILGDDWDALSPKPHHSSVRRSILSVRADLDSMIRF